MQTLQVSEVPCKAGTASFVWLWLSAVTQCASRLSVFKLDAYKPAYTARCDCLKASTLFVERNYFPFLPCQECACRAMFGAECSLWCSILLEEWLHLLLNKGIFWPFSWAQNLGCVVTALNTLNMMLSFLARSSSQMLQLHFPLIVTVLCRYNRNVGSNNVSFEVVGLIKRFWI